MENDNWNHTKHKEIAELLTEHIERFTKIIKECETKEEIIDLVETLDKLAKNYWKDSPGCIKLRKDNHFKLTK